MYKVGDLVRVINYHHKFNDRVYIVNEVTQNWFEDNIYGVDLIPNYVHGNNLELVTHLTTKEFIKEVEKLGYEAVTFPNSIGIVKGIEVLAYVSSDVKNSLDTDVEGDSVLIDDNLFKVLTLYANTPLELRGEKEQLYTLELPDTASCYRYYSKDNYAYLFDDIHDDNGYQNKFTQEEIDTLKNSDHGDLIKTLKQEPVE